MSMLLLKTQQELHENTGKWNKVIDLIKEINIKFISRKEHSDLIDKIVRRFLVREYKLEKQVETIVDMVAENKN